MRMIYIVIEPRPYFNGGLARHRPFKLYCNETVTGNKTSISDGIVSSDHLEGFSGGILSFSTRWYDERSATKLANVDRECIGSSSGLRGSKDSLPKTTECHGL